MNIMPPTYFIPGQHVILTRRGVFNVLHLEVVTCLLVEVVVEEMDRPEVVAVMELFEGEQVVKFAESFVYIVQRSILHVSALSCKVQLEMMLNPEVSASVASASPIKGNVAPGRKNLLATCSGTSYQAEPSV